MAAVVVAASIAGWTAGCGDTRPEPPASTGAAPDEAPAHAPGTQPDAALSPVQHEMQLLLAALQGTVAAIADDDLARVPALIHGVHDAREATDAALEDGSYRPPKAPDNVAVFQAMDEAFHQQLVGLVNAAQADDIVATTDNLSAVLRQCQACHAMFREMPASSAVPADQH